VTRHRRPGAAVRLAATVAALLAGQVVLWQAGRALPPVPLDGTGLLRTLDESDPLAVAVSLVRLLALAVGAALLAATALGIVARACGAVRLVARLDRATPPGLRQVLDGALGVGLAASIGLSPLPAGADPGVKPGAAVTLRRLPDVPSTTLRRLPDERPAARSERSPPTSPPHQAPATLRRLDGTPPPPAPEPAPPPSSAPPAPGPAAPAGAAGGREVVVRPGDSFWRLAERHEADRLGRRPSEAEVGACWQQLVATNRHRLAVPGDADLLFPGQVLLLP